MIRGAQGVGWKVAVVAMALFRLAHINLLWSDEDYHLAAAIQMLHGRVPYRDFWYDKPPMAALYYTLIGGYPGWPLRVLDAVYVLACCWMAYRLAVVWWGEREGRAAALLLAFFTTFYLPAATIPFAVDALLLFPHLAAIYFAKQQRAVRCGMCCALGLLANVKAVFVAATCALWLSGSLLPFALGLAGPLAVGAMAGAISGALPGFYEQVWLWGLRYTSGSASQNPIREALKHGADWLGFHGALAAGAISMAGTQTRRDQWRLGVWFALSCAALVFGNHYAPRYFLQLLPVMVIVASRGATLGMDRFGRPAAAILAVLLLVPLLRFGPRYLALLGEDVMARQTQWPDAAMDVDSQQAAVLINELKRPGDTLFVWGYRPDDYVYTRLVAPGRFWDSQPVDGVPADRHLTFNMPVTAGGLRFSELAATRPTFVIDGLGLLNPGLSPERFPELRAWLQDYELVRQTRLSRVYRRKHGSG